MSRDEGLDYLPDGFREGGRASNRAADAAEGTRRYLRAGTASSASFGGADSFVNAVNGTRDRQERDAGHAAEGRDNMSGADHRVADLGDETDLAASSAVRRVGPTARGVAEGM